MIKVDFGDFMEACALSLVVLAFTAGLVFLIVVSGGWAIIPIIVVPLSGYAIAAYGVKRGRRFWE
jgi:hypothetical protein